MNSPSALVVLDTNVASFFLSKLPEAALYTDACRGRPGALSFQTVAELRFGAVNKSWGPKLIASLERFVGRYAVVMPTDATIDAWARLKWVCRKAGRPVAADDLWVAATALAEGATLVSHDADFRPLAELTGLDLVCHA